MFSLYGLEFYREEDRYYGIRVYIGFGCVQVRCLLISIKHRKAVVCDALIYLLTYQLFYLYFVYKKVTYVRNSLNNEYTSKQFCIMCVSATPGPEVSWSPGLTSTELCSGCFFDNTIHSRLRYPNSFKILFMKQNKCLYVNIKFVSCDQNVNRVVPFRNLLSDQISSRQISKSL